MNRGMSENWIRRRKELRPLIVLKSRLSLSQNLTATPSRSWSNMIKGTKRMSGKRNRRTKKWTMR